MPTSPVTPAGDVPAGATSAGPEPPPVTLSTLDQLRSKGRLRWICIPPLRNMDEAIKELRRAKDHGACGILKKGDEEAKESKPKVA